MFDTINIIQTAGLIGIFIIIFAESGLFFAFFLPGDSLLFTAGLFAQAGFFPVTSLIIGCIVAAILGGLIGYFTGWKLGRKLFDKEASVFFKKKHVQEAENFYKKHGSATILIARFVPIIRTFAPIVAGVGKMRINTFMIFNLISGIFWPIAVTLIGYFIGAKIPNAEHYLLPITMSVVLISVAPIIFNITKKHFSKTK